MINKIKNFFKSKKQEICLEKDTFIISNAIECNECLYYLKSTSRHDYKECECGAVAVDGGLDYLRRKGTNYTEMSIISSDDYNLIRANFEWGTYGKSGNEDFHYIALEDMETSHIKAILAKNHCRNANHRMLFKKELNFRNET